MPPKAAQLPTATTAPARPASCRTQSITGRSLPLIMWNRPEPSGPVSSEPSMHRMSRGVRPSAAAAMMSNAARPVSPLTEGCQRKRPPTASSTSTSPTPSASSIAMVQPPQLPAWSHNTENGRLGIGYPRNRTPILNRPPAR